MPYIKQEMRDKIDDLIDRLVSRCRYDEQLRKKPDGVANYIVTRIVLGVLRPNDGWNYASLADVIKTFECAKLEAYQRLVSVYEDVAKSVNGDLPEYTHPLEGE